MLMGFSRMPTSVRGLVIVELQLGYREVQKEDFYMIEEVVHLIVGFPYLQAIDATIECGPCKI